MPAEEMAAAVAADPVAALRSSLIADGYATEDEIAATEARIASEVDAALTFAMDSPMAEPNEIYLDVYAEEVSR
jgi:pyruvate dehydrogenase E1 component alpha subunit